MDETVSNQRPSVQRVRGKEKQSMVLKECAMPRPISRGKGLRVGETSNIEAAALRLAACASMSLINGSCRLLVLLALPAGPSRGAPNSRTLAGEALGSLIGTGATHAVKDPLEVKAAAPGLHCKGSRREYSPSM